MFTIYQVATITLSYLVIVSIIAFTMYGLDKRKAEKGRRRIRESALLLVALFGGAIGALIGMFFFRHKTKKLMFKLLVPLFLLINIAVYSIPFVSWFVTIIGEQSIVQPEQVTSGDCIIVLGAYVEGETVSEMLRDRLDMGLELYNQKKAPKIIVSGDHGQKNYDEVNAMRLYLLDRGVPSEDIFMDHAGFDTYDSLYRARDVFLVKNPIIVSQRYHAIRACYIAKLIGLNAQGVGADTYWYYGMAGYELREYGSRYKAFLDCLTSAKPKFLGDTIPVSGSGDLTRDDLDAR